MHNLAVFHSRFHEFRTYHCAVIGDGIVESQYVQRRYLRFISYTHPGQRGLGKIAFFRTADVRLALSGYLQMKRAVYADTLQSVYKLLRIVAVMLVDKIGNADVG